MAPPPETGRPSSRLVGLTKTYSGTDFRAVDELNLQVGSGEVFGLLGPNGAGKTTTIGVLTTRVIPTGGQALVGGIDVVQHPTLVKQLIGVVSQQNTLDRQLTPVREPLLARAPLRHGGERITTDGRRSARAVPTHALRQGIGVRALRRHGPAPHGGPRHLPQTGRPLSRRAHCRTRPARTPRPVGSARRPQCRRPDHHAHHALHGGSRQALRPAWRSWTTARSWPSAPRPT